MKKSILLFALFFVASLALPAQYHYPPYSPRAKVQQAVGYANVTIEYDRPMARGRKIFGGLVPYDKMWHTGASGTTITFDQPVTVAGRAVPAGSYALQVFPRKTEWTFVLSTADDGIGHYNAAYDVVNVCVPVKQPGHFYDAYSVELDVTPGNARLYVSWTDVQVSVPISTGSEDRTMAFIDSLATAPLTSDHEEYYRAVSYLNFNKKKMDTVIRFAKHIISLEEDERYYIYETLAEAYQYLGEKDKALAALKKLEEILPREFPGQPETIASITARVVKQRAEIEQME